MTYNLKLTGFQTMEQAQALLDWYGHIGEQHAGEWLPYRDVGATFMPVNYQEPQHWEGDTLVAQLNIYGDEE